MSRLAAVVALALLGACHSPPTPEPAAQETPAMPHIVGGYSPASSNDPEVKAALAVATEALYRKFPQRALVETSTAEVQVVAGLNYRFDLGMSGGKHYTAVVYKPLKDDMVATSVEEAKSPG